MSSLEQRGTGQFHLVFRFGGRKFKKTPRSTQTEVAEAAHVRLDENLRLVIPDGADIPTFLLSDGKLNGNPRLLGGDISSHRLLPEQDGDVSCGVLSFV